MTITVENGSIVPNANSYISVIDVAAYAASINDMTFAAASTEAKEAALIRSFSALNDNIRFPWRGNRIIYTQPGMWPRKNVVELNGGPVPDNIVHPSVIRAQAIMAVMITAGQLSLINIQLNGSGGPVKRKKIDVLETEYFSPEELTGGDISALYPILSEVDGLLRPLLRDEKFEGGLANAPIALGFSGTTGRGYFDFDFMVSNGGRTRFDE